jgi:hypothetical protein
LAAGKMPSIKLSLPRRLLILQNYWRLSVSIFQSQNRRFRVFEAGYWKDFQNYEVISKEQDKNFILDFFIN